MATDTKPKPIRVGDRVVATRDLPGIPEGTEGVVKLSSGLTWPRYWVVWSDGTWMGTVSSAHVVPASEWGDFKRRREEELLRPPAPESAPVAGPGAAGGGSGEGDATPAGGGTGKVPAHLLERSKMARERKAAAGG